MKKICVVTGSRAEYGLLRWVMEGIRLAPDLTLQVVATGMHLSPEFGLTYQEIEGDGFVIDDRVEMLLSGDTASAISKSMGLALVGFGDTFARLAPDVVMVLGDRFEVFAAAAAALVARIPIAHLHGGEVTEGAIDEAFRHSLTKMAYLHFVAAEPYRDRVIQLGESPDRVFVVGGLGVDGVRRMATPSRAELEALGIRFGARNVLVTFHPATAECESAPWQMAQLLDALDDHPDVHVIFTMPNADADGRALFGLIKAFVARRSNAFAFTSLGQHRYLACLAVVDAVVGNSSSGLLEAPSLGVPTVNIGDRQRGRLKADSVVDCSPDRAAITAAIARVFTPEFRAGLASVRNPYGDGGASERVVDVLRVHDIGDARKSFYDLPGSGPQISR